LVQTNQLSPNSKFLHFSLFTFIFSLLPGPIHQATIYNDKQGGELGAISLSSNEIAEIEAAKSFLWCKINDSNKDLLIDHCRKSLVNGNRFDVKEIIIGYQYNPVMSLNDDK
jgi:hypothetical protein